MNAIEIKGLTKRYKDVVAVDGLSLSVKDGELFSLLVVNGAGKTTTVKMLSTLIEQSDGKAEIFGLDIKKHRLKIREMINRCLRTKGQDVLGGLWHIRPACSSSFSLES